MRGIGLASLHLTSAAGRKRASLLPIALLLTACAGIVAPPAGRQAETGVPVAALAAPADVEALRSLVALQDRLYRVASPLLVDNAELCKGNARNLLGFTAKTRYSYSSAYVNAAQQAFGLDEHLQVMGVLAGSGAARAGVQRGDKLLAIEGNPLPTGENAERDAAMVLAPMMTDRSEVKLQIERDGTPMTLTVPLTYACAFGFELGNTDNVVAYADGHRVLITRGMMNFARSDDELAYVMAKEMAHNILAHASRLQMNATVGEIIDNLSRIHPDMSTMVGMAGVRPMPQDLDATADRLSLYLLARAGYKIEEALPFWKNFASQYPASVLNGYTALHPATDYRISAMEKTLALIKTKRDAKQPLIP